MEAGGGGTWTSGRQLQPQSPVNLSSLLVRGEVGDVFRLRVSRFVRPPVGFLPQTWRFEELVAVLGLGSSNHHSALGLRLRSTGDTLLGDNLGSWYKLRPDSSIASSNVNIH